eukprot:CAMPEP_0175066598 /NCGR_PEP_ID=MMETSP0052_2-20121109/16604_1 /TAXON_ID=51329 ORGANISM="Polytomella parva, Strain SAG 63-3" /NCGR_SAMPLE_ID=MMETSP0052_2 /ASSEMBLY_ACC=CAM_ASM_000194 /LENGTH=941 /DNA_ID=CAMNT_0016333331 /DNA_START=144 /DNA_END=2969 /DNA_ORIENTATION=-
MKIILLLSILFFISFSPIYCDSKNSDVFTDLPPAEIKNNDDIDPQGNCKGYVDKHCKAVKPGEAELADCLNSIIIKSDVDNSVIEVDDACREEVYQYFIQRNSNLNKNVPLARACKTDVSTYCNNTWFFSSIEPSDYLLSCLKDNRDHLANLCKKEVSKLLMESAWDIRSDPILFRSCEEDVKSHCDKVPRGGGRVQGCLRDHTLELSWECREQLNIQEAQSDGSLPLSARLYSKCLNDKRNFCADTRPGSARAKDCLEMHMHDPNFSSECRVELENALARRAADFRLDSRLQTDCADDIERVCAFYSDESVDGLEGLSTGSGDVETYASITNCLQDFVDDLSSASCKARVQTYLSLSSQDIRFNSRLADACFEDRRKHCADVQPGSARVIRCLSDKRDKLSNDCRARLFDEEVRFGSNIDFLQPLKDACTSELTKFCRDIPHGQARAIRCLQEHQFDRDFGSNCRKEVASYERRASSDFRLNHRLAAACQNDALNLCAETCDIAGGQLCMGAVLRCLTDRREALTDGTCRKEVDYFLKMEVNDYRNDVLLAAACRNDVDKFCSKVETGEGRVHECLRKNRSGLSPACRREEILLEEQEAESVELRPSLLKQCAKERKAFCANVSTGRARVFRCLADSSGDPDFGEVCRNAVRDIVQRRQANWRLDPALRRACKDDVAEMCADIDSTLNGKSAAEINTTSLEGGVYRCLMNQYENLDGGCQRELSRASHMALTLYAADGILTNVCSSDVKSRCESKRPNIAQQPGEVLGCLEQVYAEEEKAKAKDASKKKKNNKGSSSSSKNNNYMNANCSLLVALAEPPSTQRNFDAYLSTAYAVSQLASSIESSTGFQLTERDRAGNATGVTLTGWSALLGLTAALTVFIYALVVVGRKYIFPFLGVHMPKAMVAAGSGGKYTMLVVKKKASSAGGGGGGMSQITNLMQ